MKGVVIRMEQDTCRKVMDMLDNNEYVQLLGIKIEEISLGHCKGKFTFYVIKGCA